MADQVKTRRKIKKVVTKTTMREQKSDAEYWRAQPPTARLGALEEIRQECPRLQRVCAIVKRK